MGLSGYYEGDARICGGSGFDLQVGDWQERCDEGGDGDRGLSWDDGCYVILGFAIEVRRWRCGFHDLALAILA